MNTKDILTSIGSLLLMITLFIGCILLISFFIIGGIWLSEKVLPWLFVISIGVFLLDLIILCPLALIPSTRGFSGICLYISSYIFSLTGWFMGLLLTYTIWGMIAVIIGLFIIGIGVVPIALIATLLNGMWIEFGVLLLIVILVFGLQYLGATLADNII